MSPERQAKAILMHESGMSINQIARKMGLWPNSVRWLLRRGEMLERERQKRRADGRTENCCSTCGELGHNALSCGIARP